MDTEYCNVITADWNQVSSNYVYPMPAYLTARVGSVVAELLENLVKLAVIDPSDIHVIGHSLGAHVSGACGAAFSMGKIGRITGAYVERSRSDIDIRIYYVFDDYG